MCSFVLDPSVPRLGPLVRAAVFPPRGSSNRDRGAFIIADWRLFQRPDALAVQPQLGGGFFEANEDPQQRAGNRIDHSGINRIEGLDLLTLGVELTMLRGSR